MAKILYWLAATRTDSYRGLPQSLQTNAEYYIEVRHYRPRPNPYPPPVHTAFPRYSYTAWPQ
jgi:hypothetical protein